MKKKFKARICVSGSEDTGRCGIDAFEKAKELGREIANNRGILMSGGTNGFSYWAAMGAKEAGGTTIAFSPASSEKEHINVFRLPLDYFDLIIYTGFGYSGRNLLLTRSSDAVIVGCGNLGAINEFSVAYEAGKPIGVLEGEWRTDETLKTIIENHARSKNKVSFEGDSKKLVQEIFALIEESQKSEALYKNED